jgi:hypothetical protein
MKIYHKEEPADTCLHFQCANKLSHKHSTSYLSKCANAGIVILIFLLSLNLSAQTKLTGYVNPFIGTDGHGHTYPGASLPHGMVQLSPDTGTEGWDWVRVIINSDNSIIGFFPAIHT